MKLRSDSTLLEAYRRECAEVKTQLLARDQTISDLQLKLSNQSQIEPGSLTSHSDALSQLSHRIDELAVQQANTLSLLQKRLASSDEGAGESVEKRLMKQKEVVASLDAQAAAQQQKLEAANQKVQQSALSLQVPDEVALMDAAIGLDVPGLSKYWPYFQAKRDRDEIQRVVTIAKMKAVAEKLEQAGEAVNPDRQ